jgi:hypothetical protein
MGTDRSADAAEGDDRRSLDHGPAISADLRLRTGDLWAGPDDLTPQRILALQRKIGNAAVGKVLLAHAPSSIVGLRPGRRLARDTSDARPPASGAAPGAGGPGWVSVAMNLAGQEMPAILVGLDGLRRNRQLGDFAKALALMPIVNRQRIAAGVVAVGAGFGFRLDAAVEALPAAEREADRAAIREYLKGRLVSGDVDPVPDFKRRSDQQVFTPQVETTALGWILGFLEFHGFKPPPAKDPAGKSAYFNGQWTTIDEVMDIVKEQGAMAGWLGLKDDEIRDPVKHAYAEAEARLPVPGASGGAARSGTLTQWGFSFTFLPATGHKPLSQPGDWSADKPGGQLAGSLTFQLHPKDDPGLELQALVQLTFFKDPSTDPNEKFRLQSVLAGGQAAWVVPFANGLLSWQNFVQLLGGAATRGHVVNGEAKHTWDASMQVAYGQQLQINVGNFYIGAQIAGSITGTRPPRDAAGRAIRDQPATTFDIQPAIVFGGSF